MSRRLSVVLLVLPLLTALACAGLGPAAPTPTEAVALPSDTPAAPTPTSAAPADPTPTPPHTQTPAPITSTPDPRPSFLAYIQAGQLLVANVTGDALGGVTQYTMPGVDDAVYDLTWSPSGEFVAFTSWAVGVSHLFVVYAEGAGTPVDLGPGSAPAWSPDSLELAYLRDDNVWVTPIEGGAPRQLSFETDWGWGRPAYLPDGSALLVTGKPRVEMGAQGNTEFVPQLLALDGSGTLSPLAGAPAPVFGRLPYDLRFSRDGARFAFSSSVHLSACAGESSYYVANADGSDLRAVASPSLSAMADPTNEIYYAGWSYDWAPGGQALLADGQVWSCAPANPGEITTVQLSLLGLDGSESLILSGYFNSPSFNRAGDRFAVSWGPDFATPARRVHLYDLAGNLLLDVGEGNQPVFQP